VDVGIVPSCHENIENVQIHLNSDTVPKVVGSRMHEFGKSTVASNFSIGTYFLNTMSFKMQSSHWTSRSRKECSDSYDAI